MKKGFTLIELLIVVLIIAILAAIAAPLYRVTIEKGKATELVKLTRDIYDSAERYAFRHDGEVINRFFDPGSGKGLDIELRGYVPDDYSTLTNEYGQFSMSYAGVKGLRGTYDETTKRFSSPTAVGDYYFFISRQAADEGVMYCYAQTGTDAVKICAGLSSNDKGVGVPPVSGHDGYKM